MTSELLVVHTVGDRALVAVVQVLARSRAAAIDFMATSERAGDQGGYVMHVTVDAEEHGDVELLVKRLNRLVDVLRVVHVETVPDPSASSGDRSHRVER